MLLFKVNDQLQKCATSKEQGPEVALALKVTREEYACRILQICQSPVSKAEFSEVSQYAGTRLLPVDDLEEIWTLSRPSRI